MAGAEPVAVHGIAGDDGGTVILNSPTKQQLFAGIPSPLAELPRKRRYQNYPAKPNMRQYDFSACSEPTAGMWFVECLAYHY